MMNLAKEQTDDKMEAEVATLQPGLRLQRETRKIVGAFNIEHNGVFIAGFQIEVALNRRDVLGLPAVKETGGRIPRNEEHHINPDGTACLYLPEALALQYSRPLGIGDFLDGPVRNFFLSQIALDSGMPFPFGEWEHGPDGFRQMLTELLGFDDFQTCVTVLELLGKKVCKGHWNCPCGSHLKLRDCHGERIRGLRQRLSLKQRRFLLARACEAT